MDLVGKAERRGVVIGATAIASTAVLSSQTTYCKKKKLRERSTIALETEKTITVAETQAYFPPRWETHVSTMQLLAAGIGSHD